MNLNFNTNQNYLGDIKFLNVNDKKNLYSNDYKNITVPKHIFINHLFMNCNNNINILNKKEILKEENNKNNENSSFFYVPNQNNNNNYNIEPEYNNKNKKKYINRTTTIRVRSKFTTIVYIKSLKF